jgi:hypothetical protein
MAVPAAGNSKLGRNERPVRRSSRSVGGSDVRVFSIGVGPADHFARAGYSLKRLGVQGQIGVSIAAGLESLELRPGR